MSKEILKLNIEKAQMETDRKKEDVKNGVMRQRYHFMPQTGWLNDPNGLIYFRGKYHFFFQHNPYSGFWDSMHWGHAISEDMLHWEYLPPALAPSEVYDDHPKGGCFSGSAIEHDNKLFLMYTGTANKGRGYEQTQCIAYSEDGIHFEKYEGNPVLTAPEGILPDMFRDPKVWKHEDMYSNEWEWMPLWKDWGPTYREGWCGFFNIPLEVRLMEDSTLQFLPIEEIKALRQNPEYLDSLVITEEETELRAGDGVAFELKLKIDLENTDADKLELLLRCGEGKKTVCLFDLENAEMSVDREKADGWSRGISRSVMYLKGKRELDVHILSDRSSLEIFTDNYRNNHSNNIFAGETQNQLKIRAIGGSAVIKEIETYGIKDCYC